MEILEYFLGVASIDFFHSTWNSEKINDKEYSERNVEYPPQGNEPKQST